MFKEIVLTSIKVFLALPGLIVGLAGLREIAQKIDFDKGRPEAYGKLSSAINGLLYILLEHWIPYILFSLSAGTFWAFMVIEPKAAARADFETLRKERLGE